MEYIKNMKYIKSAGILMYKIELFYKLCYNPTDFI